MCNVLVHDYCFLRRLIWATIKVLVFRNFSCDFYQGFVEVLLGHEEFKDLLDSERNKFPLVLCLQERICCPLKRKVMGKNHIIVSSSF